MEQIPTEVMEIVEKRFPSLPYLANHPSYTKEEYDSLHGTISEGINQRRSDFLEGYRLLCEGKEKEIAELKNVNNKLWEALIKRMPKEEIQFIKDQLDNL